MGMWVVGFTAATGVLGGGVRNAVCKRWRILHNMHQAFLNKGLTAHVRVNHP